MEDKHTCFQWPHPTLEEFNTIVDDLNKEILKLKSQVKELNQCIERHNIESDCRKLSAEECQEKRKKYEDKLDSFNMKMLGKILPSPDYGYGEKSSIEHFFPIEGMEKYEHLKKVVDDIAANRELNGLKDDGICIFIDGIHEEHIKDNQ